MVIHQSSLFRLSSLIQILLLFFYLALNIINVGKMGTGLPLLAGFIALAGGTFFFYLLRGQLAIRLHLFVFLLLVGWISFRTIVDLGDFERLKQITVATTGGILLFFLLGTLGRNALDAFSSSKKKLFYNQLILFAFLLINIIIFVSFKARLLDRVDIFYIEGVKGGYQRPGNFMIMMFLMASFVYLSITSHQHTRTFIRLFLWIGIYTLSLVLALVSSQMIGSNAATANLVAIYLMTMVISLLTFSKYIRQAFLNGRLSLPLSKKAFTSVIKYSAVSLIAAIFIASIAIQATGFDLNKTRILGFGSGSNNSLTSRFDILLETGGAQMGYAPFFGHTNVAEITTGRAGQTLHNFIPNVMAELGLVGIFIVLVLFCLVYRGLYKNIKQATRTRTGFQISVINFWLIFVFVYLFLYANLSVGKSWPCIWFFVGFTLQSLVLSKSRASAGESAAIVDQQLATKI